MLGATLFSFFNQDSSPLLLLVYIFSVMIFFYVVNSLKNYSSIVIFNALLLKLYSVVNGLIPNSKCLFFIFTSSVYLHMFLCL